MSDEARENFAAHVTRRDVLQAAAVGAAGLTISGLLAACGSGSGNSGTTSASGTTTYPVQPLDGAPAPTPGPPSGGTPVRGGTLRVGLATGGKAETLDHRVSNSVADSCRMPQSYESLVTAGAEGELVGALAESWETNRDATVWTFHLRDGVVFHDGSPFSADDVVWSIQNDWLIERNYGSAFFGSLIDGRGVRKRDRLTVEVPLKRPLAQFPEIFPTNNNTMIVRAGTTDEDYARGRGGTGPFEVVSFDPGRRSVHRAFRDYWVEGQPYVDEMTIETGFQDIRTAFNALLAGQLDIVPGVPPALAQANASAENIVIGNQPGPGITSIIMRVDKAPFRDVRVRQAFKLVADRNASVINVWSGYATPGNDLVGYTNDLFASDISASRDIEKARSLLKAAGQENLTLDLATSPVGPGIVEQGTFFAQAAAAAGIKINVQNIPAATYYATGKNSYPNRPFEMAQWTSSVQSLTSWYLLTLNKAGFYNETGWPAADAPNADRLLYDALGETDEAKARDKWHAIQQLQVDKGGYIIMNNNNWLDGYAKRVRGVQTTKVAPVGFFNFTGAWFES